MYLLDFIKEHEDWEELLDKAPYFVRIARDNGYILFKYEANDPARMSDFNNKVVQECRGIILRESDMKIVCHPFDKFGNYGESYCPDIDWSTASVQQKIDGSLMKVWFDNEQWHISTNGCIDAFKCDLPNAMYHNYGDLFMAALPFSWDFFVERLDKHYTYMFELISPYSRVVIPYDKTKLYFLGMRDNWSQQEYPPEQGLILLSYFDIPERYKLHTLEDVQKAASLLPWDEEGYVVCDKNFHRVKIKSPAYIEAHYSRNNGIITDERLLNVWLSGEEDEFMVYLSDYKPRLEQLKKWYTDTISVIQFESARLVLQQFGSQKERAEYVNTCEPKWIRPFMMVQDPMPLVNRLTVKKWLKLFEDRGLLE